MENQNETPGDKGKDKQFKVEIQPEKEQITLDIDAFYTQNVKNVKNSHHILEKEIVFPLDAYPEKESPL